MRKYVEWIIRYRVAVIIAVAAVSVLFGFAAARIEIVIDRASQLPQDHRLVVIDNEITRRFGGSRVVAVALVAKQGTIYQPAVLGKIERISNAVGAIPGLVKSNLLSLSTERVRAILGGPEGLDVRPLLEHVPTDEPGLAALRARVASQPLYTPLLVAADGQAAIVLADFREGQISDRELHKRFEAILAEEADATVELHLCGMPIWLSYLDRFARQMPLYLALAIAIIAAIHFEAFRTVQATLLPLVTAFLSTLWALGWLGLSGLPMDTWNSMTPILVLAVAAGHAVQMLKRYYEQFDRCGDNRQAIVDTVVSVGPAMVLAGVVAAIGFASLAVFDVRTVRVFGLISAAGILSALLIEMTFIPAVRSLLPVPQRGEQVPPHRSLLDPIIEAGARQVLTNPRRLLWAGAIVAVVAVAGVLRIQVNNSFVGAIPEGHPFRLATAAINGHLSGINTLHILVDSGRVDGLKSAAVLKAMSEFQERLSRHPGVGATQSLADYVKRINQAVNSDDPALFRVPGDDLTVAQYLFLYSLSGSPDDFDMVVDKDYRHALIRIYTRDEQHAFIHSLMAECERLAPALFPPGVTVSIGGGTLGVSYALNETIVHEKLINILQILAVIYLAGAVVFRSATAGLLVLVPSGLAMLVNLGVMGWAGIPLSLGTASTSALTVSIGADYAIYLLYRFRERAGDDGDFSARLHEVLLTTGRAVFYVASAIGTGYAVLITAGLLYYRQLGTLVASSMLLSALASVTVLPALMLLFRPAFLTQRRAGSPAVAAISR